MPKHKTHKSKRGKGDPFPRLPPLSGAAVLAVGEDAVGVMHGAVIEHGVIGDTGGCCTVVTGGAVIHGAVVAGCAVAGGAVVVAVAGDGVLYIVHAVADGVTGIGNAVFHIANDAVVTVGGAAVGGGNRGIGRGGAGVPAAVAAAGKGAQRCQSHQCKSKLLLHGSSPF